MSFVPARQRGATLLVVLVMLVVLTLFVVAGINLTSINLKVVGNMQAQKITEMSADLVIQQRLSDINTFRAPAAGTYAPAIGGVSGGISVTVNAAECKAEVPVGGFGVTLKETSGGAIGDYDTFWNIRAAAADSVTGAVAVVHQGVVVTLPPGSCP